ncbi:ABC transporter substrate-binding protein [Paenibacillus pinihumi]|uniref:ABC transporter substrate-binding protein n=1 Tax=Paenibacillus pinihumi TaxID=669462 RepID=UPI00041C92A3|nr:ABC transporter substrate-binding protein [Paenibacillus pinihumi]
MKKTMKTQWTFLALAALMLVTACSSKTNPDAGPDIKTPDGKKTVVVSVMSKDAFLENAAKKFEELNPDIHIEIKEHLANPDLGNGMRAALTKADIEKYVQTVTTEVLSGKGPDLIAMDLLPEDKFIEKKVLVNFNEKFAKDPSFDKNHYYQNILQSSWNGDGLYSMPISFYVQVMQANAELLKKHNVNIDDQTWTWAQFADITKKMKEQAGKEYSAFVNPYQIMADFITDNYATFVQKGNVSFDSDPFRDMMNQVKKMYDEKLIEASYNDMGKMLFSLSAFNDPKRSLIQMLDPKKGFYMKPTLNGQGNGLELKSFMNFGLNSQSKVEKEAWEFLKFMLSEEIQTSPDLNGFPVNKDATEAKLKEAGQSLDQDESAADIEIPDEKTLNETLQAIQNILNSKPQEKNNVDSKVIDIFFEEFDPFLKGQKSAEETSKLIQNRVKTYLNE